MTPVSVVRGPGPVVLGIPHSGTFVPDDVSTLLNENGLKLADTDWHIDRLYADLLPEATIVAANFHRYVIDANRDPTGASLYPNQNTTTLVPLTDFDGVCIWDTPPTSADIDQRRASFHEPYHTALAAELNRVRDIHGVAIQFDCHSIRSNIPFLFKGRLPDLNIGTNMGATCAGAIEETVNSICANASGFSSILNGRFKGGWTTRHYGQPGENIHAIQLELAQSTYLTNEAEPWTYDQTKASNLRRHLTSILTALADLAPSLGGSR